LPATGKRRTATRAGVADAESIAYLRRADAVLRELIDEVGPLGDFFAGRPTDHYSTLVRSIVGQQLSTRVAGAIYGRLLDRFGGHPPTAEEVLADDPDELRTAVGLSRAKVGYLRSLAEHILDGSLQLDRLTELPDEDVIAAVTAVSGIGPWSAQLFLLIHLRRPDVLPSGDLGIRRAVMIRYGLPALPKPAEVDTIGERWRPYRSLASMYLWRSLRTAPVSPV
jgi:DNA-3-methyladenine glycosylase II